MQGSWLVQPNAPLHGPFPATICIYPSFVDINRNGINGQNPAKMCKIFSTLKTRCLSLGPLVLWQTFFRAWSSDPFHPCFRGAALVVLCVVPHFQILPEFTWDPSSLQRWSCLGLCASTWKPSTTLAEFGNVVSPPETRKYRTCCTGGGKTSSPPGRTNGSPVDHYWWCSTHVIDLNNLWISRYLRQFDISLMLNFFTMLIWNFAWLGIILLPSYILFSSSQMSKNTYPVHTIDVILVCATLLHVCHFCIHHIETVSKRLTLCLVQLPLASFAPVPQPQLYGHHLWGTLQTPHLK